MSKNTNTPTESPYQALLKRREKLKLQKQANDEMKQKQSKQTNTKTSS